MASELSDVEPIIGLANEYLDRYRRGERPSLSEYTDRRPEYAAQIRNVISMMRMMEEHAPDGQGERSGEAAASEPALKQLGDFRILREVGRGGMGIVFEAVQESLGRYVALKVLPHHSQLNPARRKRFRREARSAAMLHHTNIVPVFAVGEEEGMLYYAMQFIQGAGLDEVISELALMPREPDANTLTRPGDRGEHSSATRVAESLLASRSARHAARSAADAPPTSPGDAGAGSRVARPRTSGVPEDSASESSPVEAEGSAGSSVTIEGRPSDSTPSETGNRYWKSVARIGVQVAEALEYAHNEGTLHRDIKPSNLLLDRHATVWITDFGLAKSLDHGDITNSGDLLGTLRYMPPEQLVGKADERSDLYSLGLTLYELLTLRPAFGMLDREHLIRAIADQEPPRPRKVDARIPRDLETIVLKAINREPAGRYQTARELASDLNRFINDEPVRARPIGTAERTLKWARRRPAVAALSASLILALLLGFGGIVWQWQRALAANDELSLSLRRESLAHARTSAAWREIDMANRQSQRHAELAEKVAVFLAAQFTGNDQLGLATYLDGADPEFDGEQTQLEILNRATERVINELDGAPKIEARLLDTLGVVYFSRGIPDKAEQLFERSLRLRSQRPIVDPELLARSQLNLACVRFLYGYYDEAESLLTQSLATRRRLAGRDSLHSKVTELVLAWLHVERDGDDKALEDFERLVRDVTKLRRGRVKGTNRDLAFALGYVAMRRYRGGEFGKSRALLIEAATMLPEEMLASDVFIRSSLALYRTFQNDQERIPDLCRQLSEAVRDDFGETPLVGVLFAELGQCAESMKRAEIAKAFLREALPDVQRALGRSPRTARYLVLYAQMLQQADELALAEQTLLDAASIFEESLGPRHPETLAVAPRLAELRQRRAALIEIANRAVDAAPEDVAALLQRGYVHGIAGMGEEASTDYANAVQLAGDPPGTLLLTGHADYLIAPHVPFNRFNGFTVEFRVKNWSGFLAYQGAAGESGIQFTSESGALYSSGDSDDFLYDKISRFRFGKPAPDTWHHLALVFDVGELRCYLDGACAFRGAAADNRLEKLNPRRDLWIGRHPQPSRRSRGLLRAVRISRIARYQEDFAAKESWQPDAHTFLLYDVQQPDGRPRGTVVPDLSGNGRDGALRKAWWLGTD